MNTINLSSQRLQFRMVESSDLDAVHQLHSIPEVDQFNTLGIPQSKAETASILHNWAAENQLADVRKYTLALILKSTGELVGLFGFSLGAPKYRRGEVWYKFFPAHWGHGYATEALQTVLDFGFNTLQLHRIEAGCAVDNLGSIKVLEKVGMTREGRCREILPLKSGWSDNYEYAILENDERKYLG